jgi:hypothetical protein
MSKGACATKRDALLADGFPMQNGEMVMLQDHKNRMLDLVT